MRLEFNESDDRLTTNCNDMKVRSLYVCVDCNRELDATQEIVYVRDDGILCELCRKIRYEKNKIE